MHLKHQTLSAGWQPPIATTSTNNNNASTNNNNVNDGATRSPTGASTVPNYASAYTAIDNGGTRSLLFSHSNFINECSMPPADYLRQTGSPTRAAYGMTNYYNVPPAGATASMFQHNCSLNCI